MANQQLSDYVSQQKAAGVNDTEIRRRLIDSGWLETDINDVMGIPVNLPPDLTDTPAPIVPVIEPVKTEVIPDNPVQKKSTPNFALFILGGLVLILVGVGVWLLTTVISSGDKKPAVVVVPTPTMTESSPSAQIVVTETPAPLNDNLTLEPYLSYKNGLSINPPKKWTVDESGKSGVILSFLNPVPDDYLGSRFTANINIVSEAAAGVNLSDYMVAMKQVLAKTFTNYKLISEKSVTLSGIKANMLEATYDVGAYKLHNIQAIMINKGTAYTISGISMESNWNTYKDMMASSLASIKFQ